MPMAQILRDWPIVAEVFISYRMACIGCHFSRFHRLRDAIDIYQLDQAALCGEIIQTIGGAVGAATFGGQIS